MAPEYNSMVEVSTIIQDKHLITHFRDNWLLDKCAHFNPVLLDQSYSNHNIIHFIHSLSIYHISVHMKSNHNHHHQQLRNLTDLQIVLTYSLNTKLRDCIKHALKQRRTRRTRSPYRIVRPNSITIKRPNSSYLFYLFGPQSRHHPCDQLLLSRPQEEVE